MNTVNKQSLLEEESVVYEMPVSVAIIYLTETRPCMSSYLARQVSIE